LLLHSSSVMLALKQALSLSSTSLTGSAVSASAFVFGINTANTSAGSSTSTQFKLPLTTSTGLNAVVDWGDSTTDTITVFNAAEVTHTYASSGTYTISITGTLPGFRFFNAGDKLKIINISSWGVLDITTDSAFRGCTNLTCSATDAPTITSTSLLSTFRACTNFNGNIGNWDVSAVTNMTTMFVDATAFNNGGSSSIDNWDVTSSVTNMSNMFHIQRLIKILEVGTQA
jgi:surface protein